MYTTDISVKDEDILNNLTIDNIEKLNSNYLEDINTDDKAYIIGYISSYYKYCINKDKNTIIFYSESYEFLCNIKNIFNKDINIKEFNNELYKFYYFKISNKNIIENIDKHILNDDNKLYFPDFNDDKLNISFIRGFFDKNGSINKNNSELNCYIYYNDNDELIIQKIKLIIDIPYKNYSYKNYKCLHFTDINVIDFLGKIYNNYNLYNTNYYNSYLNILNDDSKLPYCKISMNDPNAVLPSKVRESDVGYDLTIINKVKDFNNTTSLYDTGISINIQYGYYAEIVPRSSLSKSGYILANSVGIIDPGYRGNLYIALSKIDKESTDIQFPFKCCQLIIKKQVFVNLFIEENKKDTNTSRNIGGFGSTNS